MFLISPRIILSYTLADCFEFMACLAVDFCQNIKTNAESLLEFFGFKMHPRVAKFIESHTHLDLGGVSLTRFVEHLYNLTSLYISVQPT